jgi:hypothetical protein
MRVEISERAKKWGYLMWPKDQDDDVETLLGSRQDVRLVFRGTDHGQKRIDWKYRRISIGYRWTRMLPKEFSVFVVSLKKGGVLVIDCE